MPDGNQHVTVTTNHDLSTMRFEEALEIYSPNFQAVLPPNVPLEHFKRMIVTAVNVNPDLRYADRRTLFNACIKCASDGLLPDGREAALVVFRTRVKDRDGNERQIDAVNYLPMVAGIRKRLRNTGEILSDLAEVVYRNDRFQFRLGDNPSIEHEPAPIDAEPGDVVGAYAIIKLANGEVLREVVRLVDIERARSFSRAKDGPAWKNWYGEMARKVALRRCAKAAPSSSAVEKLLTQMLDRDQEAIELPPAEELPAIPPRPRRADFPDTTSAEEPEPFRVITGTGKTVESPTVDAACAALQQALRDAEGEAGVERVWRANARLIAEFREGGLDQEADGLATSYAERLSAARTAEFDSADAGSSPAATKPLGKMVGVRNENQ